jgi:hypothetical protein
MADPKTIEITILGEKKELRPTLRAAKIVNSSFAPKGFQSAYEAIQRGDNDALVQIVAAGLDVRKPDDAKKLEEDMFLTGFFTFIGPATAFVTLLGNGGRDPLTTTDDDGGDEKNG